AAGHFGLVLFAVPRPGGVGFRLVGGCRVRKREQAFEHCACVRESVGGAALESFGRGFDAALIREEGAPGDCYGVRTIGSEFWFDRPGFGDGEFFSDDRSWR